MISETFKKELGILNRLESKGHEAYFVGGSIRDSLMGLDVSDIDITTSATPEEVKEVFSDLQVLEIGLAFGTVAVVCEGEPVEITTFRTEGKYSDNRRPDEVSFTRSLANDLQRRDLTINALACKSNGELVDLVNGGSDIKNKIIRTVGNADERFSEDPLRILRALRFASKLGFEIEEKTSEAIIKNKELTKTVSCERIQKELNGILMGKNVREILVNYADVFATIIPEIEPMIGFEQNNPTHKYDVWEHTTVVVEQAKGITQKLAGLFHDIGKPKTYTFSKGKGHFYGHEIESEKMAREILTRLRYSRKQVDEVCFLIKHHCSGFSTKKYSIAKYIFDVGPQRYFSLIEFAIADDKGKSLGIDHFKKYELINKYAEEYLANKPILSHKDLDIGAKDLMELGYNGKQVGEVLRLLCLASIGGHRNEKSKQLAYLETLKKQGVI